MSNKYLIIGLGNVGSKYKNTRHNIGFEVIENLAKKYSLEFKKSQKLQGYIAHGMIGDKDTFLLMPTTFMNSSGISVRLTKDYYKIDIQNILVIVDDVAIEFGEFRLRKDSGTGGHNGLLSIQEHLNSSEYARLRVGVGDRKFGNLESYVLSKFSQNERNDLEKIISHGTDLIEKWQSQGIELTMNEANIRSTKNKIKKDEINGKQ
jgi:peptidyl-tRNA hydrolase, PTH1 family